MPIHDWTRMEAGDFHHFHQGWITNLANALNSGGLPPGYMAMAEQVTGGPIPDVITLQSRRPSNPVVGGVAVKEKPPTARFVARLEKAVYARRADRVVIRHARGRVVAVIEIVSPGNKSNRHTIRTFVEKAAEILRQGVNLLVVDLFPPTPRDPKGLHKLIWDEVVDEPFDLPPDKPLTVAAYLGGEAPMAFVDFVGMGDALPSAPIFLSDSELDYVPAPLEETYNQAWAVYPEDLKEIMQAQPAANPPPAAD
jgi:hypothetical protein